MIRFIPAQIMAYNKDDVVPEDVLMAAGMIAHQNTPQSALALLETNYTNSDKKCICNQNWY